MATGPERGLHAPAALRAAALLGVWLAACSHASPLEGRADAAGATPADAAAEVADGAPESMVHDNCVAICALAPAECPSPDCVSRCEEFAKDPHCGRWVRQLLACQAHTTKEDSFCLNGMPWLKESACTMETRMLTACHVSGTGRE
jgi:hypothetical protein